MRIANWFIQGIWTAFMVMVFIYIIKWTAGRFNIPVVKEIAEGV